MNEALRPTYVMFDAHSFFDHPDDPRRQRIGVVTQIGYAADGDALHVQVGLGDSGTHDALAERMGPIKNKRLPLPPDMYTCEGIVTGWYYPDLGGSIGIIAGQNERRINPEATCSYDETNRRLRMAGLALGYVLLQDPRKITISYHGKSLVFGAALLGRTGEKIGRYIYNS